MTLADLLMLALGLIAIIGGAFAMKRRGGAEEIVYARRIAGMMAVALGLFLTIFAIGLAGALAADRPINGA